MADIFDAAIASIHVQLNALQGTVIPFEIKTGGDSKHKKPPCILWLATGGKTLPPDSMNPGRAETVIAVESTDWIVLIWGADRGTCRAIYRNMIRAARLDGLTSDRIKWGIYQWLSGSGQLSNLGEVLSVEVTLFADILSAPQPVRTVEKIIATMQVKFPTGNEVVGTVTITAGEE